MAKLANRESDVLVIEERAQGEAPEAKAQCYRVSCRNAQ